MRKLSWIVAGVALLSCSVAMAQDQGRRGDAGPKDRPAHGQRPPADRPPANRPPANRPPANRPPAHRPPAHRPPMDRPPHVGRRPPHRYLSGGSWRHSIRGPAFRYPPGFAYRIWATGAILPSVFLSSTYYYDDYAALGLSPPPAGYRWVRYGTDLLLVNVFTGRVADVVDGAFY